MTVPAAKAAQDALISRAVAQSLGVEHPLSQFGVEALVAGAARPRPGALAFADHLDGATSEVSFADLFERAGACLGRLREFELPAGERVMICASPGAQSFIVLVAALAAGLEPVLAPMPLPSTGHALALAARQTEAAALFAPARFCDVDFEEPLLALVGQSPSIRFIGSLSGALDGASDFSAAALSAKQAPRARLLADWSTPKQSIGAVNDVGDVDFVSQSALLAAALDLVRLARRQSSAPILSLCAPSSLPALVAGPLAALIAGEPLHFLAPFETSRFVEALKALGRVQLVAPSMLLPDLAKAGLLTGDSLMSVTAVAHGATDAATRFNGPAGCPIIELAMHNGRVTLA